MVQKVFAEKPVVVLLQPFCGPLYNDVTTAIRSLYRLQRFLLLKSGHGPKEVNDVARICAFDGDVGGGDAAVFGWGRPTRCAGVAPTSVSRGDAVLVAGVD
jgi:hypothetical protein